MDENMSPEEIRKLQSQNCIFCKLGRKEIPSRIVYEDDLVFAFLDIQPLSFGHLIVTTKEHYVFFSQVSDKETQHLFKVAKQLSQALLKALQVKGTNIFMANGEFAGQRAPHFLLHIVPRKEDDHIPYFTPHKDQLPNEYLDKVQAALISRIDDVMETDMKSKFLDNRPVVQAAAQAPVESASPVSAPQAKSGVDIDAISKAAIGFDPSSSGADDVEGEGQESQTEIKSEEHEVDADKVNDELEKFEAELEEEKKKKKEEEENKKKKVNLNDIAKLFQ